MEQQSKRIHSIEKRILEAVASEQESLAKILAALAIKVEKTAHWLPAEAPEEPFNILVEKVKGLECVIGKELAAVAAKEEAIKGILHQFFGSCSPCPPQPGKPLCPCHLFQSCKIMGYCLRKPTKGCWVNENFDGY